MSSSLGPIVPVRLSGQEVLRRGGQPLPVSVLQFWQWACSDFVTNTFRGWFAEFIVASDLGITDTTRTDWEGWDLRTSDGVKIEVKATGNSQSWAQKRRSTPSFSVKKARAWDSATDTMSKDVARHSDVYVFCLHKHQDQATLDPLDMAQWTFFVVSTGQIDAQLGDQQSVTLQALAALGATETEYGRIGQVIGEAMTQSDAGAGPPRVPDASSSSG